MTIEIKELSKHYQERAVVDHFSLNIEKGELFALLGQNAAGKTTTIKMLCGLVTPTSGDALLDGVSIVHNPIDAKKNLNISPQETAVAPNLTVVENLRLMARIYGYSKIQAEQHAIAQMNTFGLQMRQHEKAKILSGGYKRRLSVAMAMMSNPKILFLDEPTLGMDVRARRDLWGILRQLKGHVTIVLTTHYLEEVEMLADRVGIMHQGKLRALGTTQQLMRQTGKQTFEDVFLELTEGESR
ncbi:ABC transporter ATP-binding protein [Lysinibacillus sphaericus]|uniref:ABC transporter ATP-binding protein n=1 Tax=Lysinibacillus sphaericus TaxID=1421 RepID=UPI001C5EC704